MTIETITVRAARGTEERLCRIPAPPPGVTISQALFENRYFQGQDTSFDVAVPDGEGVLHSSTESEEKKKAMRKEQLAALLSQVREQNNVNRELLAWKEFVGGKLLRDTRKALERAKDDVERLTAVYMRVCVSNVVQGLNDKIFLSGNLDYEDVQYLKEINRDYARRIVKWEPKPEDFQLREKALGCLSLSERRLLEVFCSDRIWNKSRAERNHYQHPLPHVETLLTLCGRLSLNSVIREDLDAFLETHPTTIEGNPLFIWDPMMDDSLGKAEREVAELAGEVDQLERQQAPIAGALASGGH